MVPDFLNACHRHNSERTAGLGGPLYLYFLYRPFHNNRICFVGDICRNLKDAQFLLLPRPFLFLLHLPFLPTSKRHIGRTQLTLFTHALAVTRDNYLAHYNFATDLAKNGQTARAIEHYNKAIEIKPYYTDAVLGLGDVYAGKGDVDGAIGLFQKTLSFNPNADAAAHAHNNLGIMYQEKGMLDKSLLASAKGRRA